MNIVEVEVKIRLEKKATIDRFQVRKHIHDMLTEKGYIVEEIFVDYIRKESEK